MCCGGFVGDVWDATGGAVLDAAESVVEGVGDFVESAWEAVEDAGSWIDDNIIQPALDDPIKTAAMIAAVVYGGPAAAAYFGTSAAMGAAIAGAIASGTATMLEGGNLTDILKSAAVAAAASSAGSAVGGTTGTAAGTTPSGVAGATGSQAAGAVAAGTARGATAAALTGQDIGEGALTGGVTAGVSQGVNYGASVIRDAMSTDTGNTTIKLEDSKFIADDAATMQANGLNEQQIATNLRASGVNPLSAADAANMASNGYSADTISQNLNQSYSQNELFRAPRQQEGAGTKFLKQTATRAITQEILGKNAPEQTARMLNTTRRNTDSTDDTDYTQRSSLLNEPTKVKAIEPNRTTTEVARSPVFDTKRYQDMNGNVVSILHRDGVPLTPIPAGARVLAAEGGLIDKIHKPVVKSGLALSKSKKTDNNKIAGKGLAIKKV
jgi:hypothetical protein